MAPKKVAGSVPRFEFTVEHHPRDRVFEAWGKSENEARDLLQSLAKAIDVDFLLEPKSRSRSER